MTRWSLALPVYFVEEPETTCDGSPFLASRQDGNVMILTPHLDASGHSPTAEELLDSFLCGEDITRPLFWYYAPQFHAGTQKLNRAITVYDCMDELSGFLGAPPDLLSQEQALFRAADLVFTGGLSLYESKRRQHHAVHLFPSSVDAAHFGQARDQPQRFNARNPVLGYCGVIDERLDLALLEELCCRRPDWLFEFIGPVAKIDPASLPQAPNIRYLGQKPYSELPQHMGAWDVALMPFALNDATRYISPTKAPEYLAAGLPVVTTPIADVVATYGADGEILSVALGVDAFEAAVEHELARKNSTTRIAAADRAVARSSWDSTWSAMAQLVRGKLEEKAPRSRRGHGTLGEPSGFDYLIVGAGFAGSVLAERLANRAGKKVLIVDRRPHIGGNAYDCYDESGILVHRYGPHIFHTNSGAVADYLSQFTRWRPYEHKVLSRVRDRLVPMPINIETLERLFGTRLDADGMRSFLASRAERVDVIRTSEDVVISSVGRELYELFFQGYTLKQWGVGPEELDKSVAARVPARFSRDDRYFTDTFQAMPLNGYTRLFENMLDHPRIKILLNTDFREIEGQVEFERLIYTGPIDEFFDYRYGALPYRSLAFRHESHACERFQEAAVVNYPGLDVGFTRITEYKQLTGQVHPSTSISYEFPCAHGDPYYPVPRAENTALFKRYQALADKEQGAFFVGRLATYRYYNMDQVVAQALALFERIEGRRQAGIRPERSIGQPAV
jgi:UDP-galactopyranose mutase